MRKSLSVLLHVHNAETTVSDTVHQALEIAADLAEQFELLIIDDGSSDATDEIIDELTHAYPQVRSIRHRRFMGREAALRTGLKHCRGELVCLRDLTSDEMRAAYRIIDRGSDEDIRRASRPARPNYLSRLAKFALGE